MRKRGLYGQTVTVYHPVPMKKRVDRYVLRDVFCQIGSREVPDAAGAKSGAAMLLVVPENNNVRAARIGGTTDISAGQLIDRTGQLLGLPFPSGKHLDALSREAEKKDSFRVKCADCYFSLSVLCAGRGRWPGCDNLRTAVVFAWSGAPCGSRGLVECRWSGRRAAGKVNKKG